MVTTHYLISISAKAIIPKGDSKAMKELEQVFGPVIELSGEWHLTKGIHGRLYGVTVTDAVINDSDIRHLKELFDAEKRILSIFRLQSI